MPTEFLPELGQAKLKIAHDHQHGHRETLPLAKGTRRALTGNGDAVVTSEGEMVARVARELMSLGPVVALNDEAHHCYSERPGEALKLTAEEKAEAKDNEEAAWRGRVVRRPTRFGISPGRIRAGRSSGEELGSVARR